MKTHLRNYPIIVWEICCSYKMI